LRLWEEIEILGNLKKIVKKMVSVNNIGFVKKFGK